MKIYDQQAVKKVIDQLISIEPKCEPCEQCIFGYRFDESSKQSCNKQKLKIQEQYKDWERKMQKWQKRYNNVE